jgi:hypothetical protein
MLGLDPATSSYHWRSADRTTKNDSLLFIGAAIGIMNFMPQKEGAFNVRFGTGLLARF